MKEQKNRIEAFLLTLDENEKMDQTSSVVLNTNMQKMGGVSTNSGNCINENQSLCKKSKNGGDCKNYDNACVDTTNTGSCLNTSLKRNPCGPIIGTNTPSTCG